MLTVTASNATQVVISDNVDSTRSCLAGSGGTQNGNSDHYYDLYGECHGHAGATTAQVVVTVNRVATAPTVTMVANPTSITPGKFIDADGHREQCDAGNDLE